MTAGKTASSDRRVLRLSPDDNIGVATTTLEAGQTVACAGQPITLAQRIPTGHKLALVDIAAGQKVVKYGAPIGSASRAIAAGEYVHTHNMQSDYLPTYTLDGSRPFLKE